MQELQELENTDYPKGVICKKEMSHEEKVKMLENNITNTLIGSVNIGQITKDDLNDVFEVLKHENILVPYLPVFRYEDMVLSMGKSTINDDFEHGKYTILTTNEINEFLNAGYLVFIYTFSDEKFNNGENLKFRTVILSNS